MTKRTVPAEGTEETLTQAQMQARLLVMATDFLAKLPDDALKEGVDFWNALVALIVKLKKESPAQRAEPEEVAADVEEAT